MSEITKYQPDTLEHLEQTDLVQLSRDLLGAVVESTKALDPKVEATPERLKELKVTLGYLNGAVNATKAKMQFFKMTGLDEKVRAVRRMSEQAE